MNLLILGGTIFVGRHLVEAALARGHRVTLFNRGHHNPGLFPHVEHVVGERDGGLAPLAGRDWDAVLDTSGYVPRLVGDSARLFKDHAARYLFVSSISAYAEFARPGLAEDGPLGTLEDPGVETISRDTYGPLKVLCEKEVQAAYPDRALIVRPGIIAGPHDPTDRFTYWAWRMAQGGRALAPAPTDAPIQAIDARDLGEWMVRMVEDEATGVFNAAGLAHTRAEFLAALTPSGADTRVAWADEDLLRAGNVDPGRFPFWTPTEDANILAVSSARAVEAGLTYRPLAETAADTLAWLASEPEHQWQVGLQPDEEARLFAKQGAV